MTCILVDILYFLLCNMLNKTYNMLNTNFIR